MWPISVNLSPSIMKYALGFHIGDVENFSVRRDARVLGHAALGEFQIADDFFLDQIDLREALGIFTGENCVAPVDGKIGMVDTGSNSACRWNISSPWCADRGNRAACALRRQRWRHCRRG